MRTCPGRPSRIELSQKQPLPDAGGVNRVIICGMGGSAIGADLLAAYIGSSCPLPVIVHRDYNLPAWACGTETLVIASSHSGNTEETLEAFQAAISRECRLVAVTTGGKLAIGADQAGPLWKFTQGQPRCSRFPLGCCWVSFRLGLIPILPATWLKPYPR
jgi:glucose/mannose-6-phosphate isomerase